MNGTSFGTARGQRGSTTLIATLLTLLAMALALAYAQRSLSVDQHGSANRVRSLQAFEAAQAGIEWTLSKLNHPGALDASCRPSTAPGALAFRDSHLRYDASAASHRPLLGADGKPLRAACRRDDSGWTCACPVSESPILAAAAGASPRPGFTVWLETTTTDGTLRLISRGCNDVANACDITPSSGSRDAHSRIEVLLALVPSLAARPIAPLTVRGDVATAAALGLHNADSSSGGAVVHAGGVFTAPAARIQGPPGIAASLAVVERDATLAEQDPARLFAGLFGIDVNTWRQQQYTQQIDCNINCSTELSAASTGTAPQRQFAIRGDLVLDGPATIGTPDRPVALVANGDVQLRGDVVIHGVVVGRRIEWNDTGDGARLVGAAIARDVYTGTGTPELIYDPRVLDLLRHETGSFVRVPGSWKDF